MITLKKRRKKDIRYTENKIKKIADVNAAIWTITLNVNVLKNPCERQTLSDWIKRN